MLLFKEKPVISDQYGALAMAFLPFGYAIIQANVWRYDILFFGIAWFFLYLFSYPFFQLVSRTPTVRNKQWAIIYFLISLLSVLPALFTQPTLLCFLFLMLPFGVIQYYYAKKRDERNLFNDIAAIFCFGIMGVATYFLAKNILDFRFFIHPVLFFIATTFYVKSLTRERKNPLYSKLSIGSPLLLGLIYLAYQTHTIFIAYLFALARAIVVPRLDWNIKQVGMFEFLTLTVFFIGLIWA